MSLKTDIGIERSVRRRLVPSRILLLFVFLVELFAVDSAQAQNRTLMNIYSNENLKLSQEQMERLRQRASLQRDRERIKAENTLLNPMEGSLDQDIYIVGPNDLFTISIGGSYAFVSEIPVGSDGILMLPVVGGVDVAGKTLRDSRRIAIKKMKTEFTNVTVDIGLGQPRGFYVHVTGAVPEPGRYVTTAVSRVEDVLKQAFLSDSYEEPVSNPRYRPGLRNIKIKRRSGEVLLVDLVSYYRKGELTANPYLQDGDNIIVPGFQASENGIFINGNAIFPGEYDFKKGDKLSDIIRIAFGNSELDDLAPVRVSRILAGGERRENFTTIGEVMSGGDMDLQARDNVHFPDPERLLGTAEASGFVEFPGRYPIVEGRTTLKDLVDMAGGIREDALIAGAYVERGAYSDKRSILDQVDLNRNLRPGLILSDTSAVLNQMRLADVDLNTRYYLIRSLGNQNRLSLDVGEALTADAETTFLMHGDRLHIPKDDNTVKVVGEVLRPGALPFISGTNFSHYISKAGGKGELADKEFVIKRGTGRLVNASEARIESGDIIFVDREGGETLTPEIERLRVQLADAKIRRYQVVLQTLGTIGSLASTYILYRRFLQD